MATSASVERAGVLAYRVHAQGLDRVPGATVECLSVLDLGVQDTPAGVSRLALSIRLGEVVDLPPSLALVWSLRGAPHVHRRSDLPALAGGLWPTSDRDARLRLGGAGHQLDEGERSPLEAWALTLAAMREVVDEPMTKGEASEAVTERLTADLAHYCRSCECVHVNEMLFRNVALNAGLEILPGQPKLTLAPMPGWRAAPPDPAAAAGLLDKYLRLLGPGTEREAAGFLGTQTADAKAKWPDSLVELRLDGRRVYFPSDGVDELRTARPARLVRLLPPSDPFLQTRDRDLLVPDRLRQKELWRPLGNPGAVLVDTEIVGTWRPRATAKRLVVTVTAFGPLAKRIRAAISREADLVAAVRGASDVEVVITDGA